jgi:hypothetical protein
MIIFKNANYPTFLAEAAGKRIILFGTGGTFRDFLASNAEKLTLLETVDFILDNDVSKAGRDVYLPIKTLQVEHVDRLLQKVPGLGNCVVIVLVAEKHVLDVVAQLDALPQFDGIACYYGISALTWGREVYPPLPVRAEFPAPGGNFSIPKIIHCIWFGGQPMGERIERCIASWRRYCPDYELKLWNEDNYDISRTPLYVRQAYEAEKYAFVSDYVRLDVVLKYGGFYLDTDVELFKGLDDFLSYKAVFGYTNFNRIGTGIGFGSVAGCELIKKQMDAYKRLIFRYPDGTYNLVDYINNLSDYLRRKNASVNNTLCICDDILFIPSSYLSPYSLVQCSNGYEMPLLYQLTASMCAMPSYDCLWLDFDISHVFQTRKRELAKINARLLADWERTHKAPE